MPEVYIIGEVQGAAGFGRDGLHCDWKVLYDEDFWTATQGLTHGGTHVDASDNFGSAVWNHPIDVAFSCSSLTGWPRLQFEVWYQDMFHRNILAGYGAAFVPMAPGTHELQVPIWRPRRSFVDNLSSYFIEDHPQLERLDCVANGEDRYHLDAESTGYVYLRLNIVTSAFDLGAAVELGSVRAPREQVRDMRCVPVPTFGLSEGVEPLDHAVGTVSRNSIAFS